MNPHPRSSVCCIIPPHLLEKIVENGNEAARSAALETLAATAQIRGERSVRGSLRAVATLAAGDGRRTIFDCRNSRFLPSAVVARTENGEPSSDESVNRLFDGLGTTRDFFEEVFERNSLDDMGMRLDGYVHYGTGYNNAVFDGSAMIFGDGDGVRFTDFTKSLDVIAHELGHGVTQHTADLLYQDQSGALNESMSDVFGSLVKQWSLGQAADEADWLIGADVFTPGIDADALRSMEAPGTAYDNDLFGQDPQPAHMRDYDHRQSDNGGVHINSGIPNKAFHLVATGIGGNAWEAPAHIWYETLKASTRLTQFQEFADRTYTEAGRLYGTNGDEQQVVQAAWKEVGIRITGAPTATARSRAARAPRGRDGDSLTLLTKQIEALSAQLTALAKKMETPRAAAGSHRADGGVRRAKAGTRG